MWGDCVRYITLMLLIWEVTLLLCSWSSPPHMSSNNLPQNRQVWTVRCRHCQEGQQWLANVSINITSDQIIDYILTYFVDSNNTLHVGWNNFSDWPANPVKLDSVWDCGKAFGLHKSLAWLLVGLICTANTSSQPNLTSGQQAPEINRACQAAGQRLILSYITATVTK